MLLLARIIVVTSVKNILEWLRQAILYFVTGLLQWGIFTLKKLTILEDWALQREDAFVSSDRQFCPKLPGVEMYTSWRTVVNTAMKLGFL